MNTPIKNIWISISTFEIVFLSTITSSNEFLRGQLLCGIRPDYLKYCWFHSCKAEKTRLARFWPIPQFCCSQHVNLSWSCPNTRYCPKIWEACPKPFSINCPPQTVPIPGNTVTGLSPMGEFTKVWCFIVVGITPSLKEKEAILTS